MIKILIIRIREIFFAPTNILIFTDPQCASRIISYAKLISLNVYDIPRPRSSAEIRQFAKY
jgi:hypothetical protein